MLQRIPLIFFVCDIFGHRARLASKEALWIIKIPALGNNQVGCSWVEIRFSPRFATKRDIELPSLKIHRHDSVIHVYDAKTWLLLISQKRRIDPVMPAYVTPDSDELGTFG